MPGIRNVTDVSPLQIEGSEYGGSEVTIAAGIQPMGPDALTPADKLRLGYVTGIEDNTNPHINIDDKRQMLGLRPANGKRPLFLANVSPVDDPRLTSEAERQGYTNE
jgi:hypothetical protein